MSGTGLKVAAVPLALIALGGLAHATDVVTVDANAVIYAAGQTTAPGGGVVPTALLTVPANAQCFTVEGIAGSLSCSSPEGCITINRGSAPGHGENLNDPDGAHAQVTVSQNDGTAEVSGIKAPGAGYLVGLFVAGLHPTGPAPAALDFTTGEGTGFITLAPLLDQTFFTGDGRAGDDRGPKQFFTVPTGARKLYFGISDACNYQGTPSCYQDNFGSYQVAVAFRRLCTPP